MKYTASCDYCGYTVEAYSGIAFATIASELLDLDCFECGGPMCGECVKWRIDGNVENGICNMCVDPENTTITRAIDLETPPDLVAGQIEGVLVDSLDGKD